VCQGYILIVVIVVVGSWTALADHEPTASGPFLVFALTEVPTPVKLALQLRIPIKAEETTGSGSVHRKVRHHLRVPNIEIRWWWDQDAMQTRIRVLGIVPRG